MEKLNEILTLFDELKTTVESQKNCIGQLDNQVADKQATVESQNNLIHNNEIELQSSDFGNSLYFLKISKKLLIGLGLGLKSILSKSS